MFYVSLCSEVLSSNLCEVYRAQFYLIFLLPPTPHCTHVPCFRSLSKLTVARRADYHRHSHDRHENVYVIHKSAFLSLPPYHIILQAFAIVSLKEICLAKHHVMFACCSVADILNARNQQCLGKFADIY